MKALSRHRVLSVSMGPTHSAVIVEPGHVYLFGRNAEGQLGNGNAKVQNAPIEVKTFEEKPAFVSRFTVLKVNCFGNRYGMYMRDVHAILEKIL